MDDVNFQISTKPYQTLPLAAKAEIKLVSYRKDLTPDIVGSYAYRIQKYPADIDIMENVDSYQHYGSWEPATDERRLWASFAQVVQQLARNISRSPDHYLLDFKAGLDDAYYVDMGGMENGLYTPPDSMLPTIKNLASQNLYSISELDQIFSILSKSYPLDADDYDSLTKVLRNRFILRWNVKELIQGTKVISHNRTIILAEAVSHFTLTKMDMAVLVGGKFMEVSNIWSLFLHNPDGSMHYLTPQPKLEYVPFDIERGYWSNMYFGPFKIIKRMFSYARMYHIRGINKYDRYITLTAAYITGDTSALYQIKSELATIVELFDKHLTHKDSSVRDIILQLDGLKFKLEINPLLNDGTAQQMGHMIDQFNAGILDVSILESLSKMLGKIISNDALRFLEKNGLNPPPPDILPTDQAAAEMTESGYIQTNALATIQYRRTYDWTVVHRATRGASRGGIVDEDFDTESEENDDPNYISLHQNSDLRSSEEREIVAQEQHYRQLLAQQKQQNDSNKSLLTRWFGSGGEGNDWLSSGNKLLLARLFGSGQVGGGCLACNGTCGGGCLKCGGKKCRK